MAKRRNNVPVIPEPSPQFAFWSGVAAAVALIAMLAFEYANGWMQ